MLIEEGFLEMNPLFCGRVNLNYHISLGWEVAYVTSEETACDSLLLALGHFIRKLMNELWYRCLA